MAFNPADFLKDLIPDNINMFGAGPSATTQSLLDNDFINADAYKKAQQQSVFQGLLNAGLSYAAQPKNQGYGSIFPYLAKAGISGVNAAQKPFNQLTQDVMTSEKIEAMKRAKDKQIQKDKFLSTWGQNNTGDMRIDGDQNVNVAAQGNMTGQDYEVGSTLMGGRSTPNPMNVQAPNFDTNQASIQQLLDNQLLGADPKSFLLDNNNLEQKMTGSFDPMKAIDDAVANNALDLKDALSMKASIATANNKGGVISTDPNQDIRDKFTGELIVKAQPKNNYTFLDEAALQAYEQRKGLTLGSTRRFGKDNQRLTYQIDGDTDKISVVNAGAGGVNIENNIGDKATNSNIENIQTKLYETKDRAELAYKNLPRIRGAYNLMSTAYTGQFSDAAQKLEKFRKKFAANTEEGKMLRDRFRDPAASSEELETLLGGDVFPLIKLLGIGARGLDTPAERDFLISVFTGSRKMEESTLKAITARRLREAKNQIMDYNKRLGLGHYNRAKKDFLTGTQATGLGREFSNIDIGIDGGKIYDGLTSVSSNGMPIMWGKLNKQQDIQGVDGDMRKTNWGWRAYVPVKEGT